VIDVRLLRTDPNAVRAALARRGQRDVLDQLERAIAFDELSRDIIAKRDAIRAEVNDLSKAVGKMRRDGDTHGAEELQLRSRALGDHERVLANEFEIVQGDLRDVLLRIPNLPHPDAPDGAGDVDNPLVKGPIGLPETFPDHRRVPHWDTGTELGILDNERATKISGAMFTMQRGAGAALSRALCQYALDRNVDRFEDADCNRSTAEVRRRCLQRRARRSVADPDGRGPVDVAVRR
jgi:seryl-tRNA synthetase